MRFVVSGRSPLRCILLFLLLGLCPAQAQNGQINFKCSLEGTGIHGEWDIAVDTARGVYSARVGNSVVANGQPAEPMMSFAAVTPQVKGVKLTLNMSPSKYWLFIQENGAAATSSMSGGFFKQVGQCTNVQ